MKNLVSLKTLFGAVVLAGLVFCAAPAMAQNYQRGYQPAGGLWHPTYGNYGFTGGRSVQSFRAPVVYSNAPYARTNSVPMSYSVPLNYSVQTAPMASTNATSSTPIYSYAAPPTIPASVNSSGCGGCGCGCGKTGSCGCGH